jgi:hypothetical protein
MTDRVQLHVRVTADGSVTAETRNVTGEACLDYIALLENLLEATTVDSAYTADYARGSVQQAAGHDLENPDELRQY